MARVVSCPDCATHMESVQHPRRRWRWQDYNMSPSIPPTRIVWYCEDCKIGIGTWGELVRNPFEQEYPECRNDPPT